MRTRIIPRLDVKGPNIVKGICLEGMRVVGKPSSLSKKYYEEGADEILYMDIVASLYERNNLINIVKEATKSGIFIPMTVGGGIRTPKDIKTLLRAGADKVAINTAATKNPTFISKAAQTFGSQCIVGSIEAKCRGNNKWEAYIDNGRERTGLDVIEWAQRLVELGVGELLITSVDRDGTQKGYDIPLIKSLTDKITTVPIIACGGAGKPTDVYECINESQCDAISLGSLLHYNTHSLNSIKKELENKVLTTPHSPVPPLSPQKYAKTISIIDYDVGNIKSVEDAFRFLGCSTRLIDNPQEVLDSEILILPGDGAFGYAINELRKKKLIEPLKKYATSGKPLMGICVGMQLLLSDSDEFGSHKGLDFIQGTVTSLKHEPHIKIPHMGWNQLIRQRTKDSLMADISHSSSAYFIHSFRASLKNPEESLAHTTHGTQEFSSIIKKDNIVGFQFHPEKSARTGLQLLKNFCNTFAGGTK